MSGAFFTLWSILRALALRALVLLALSFGAFGMLAFLPGDPAELLIAADPAVSPAEMGRLRALRGLDAPLFVQWWRWLVGSPGAVRVDATPAIEHVVASLPPAGPAVVLLGGSAESFPRPGSFVRHHIVRAADGDQVRVYHVRILSPGETPPSPADAGRHAAGGALCEERQDDGSRTQAHVPVFAAGPDGTVHIDAEDLVAGGTGLRILDGPGAVWQGRYTHELRSGEHRAIRYWAWSNDGLGTQGVFLVVTAPAQFRRGALFALVGDTGALGYSAVSRRPVWEHLFGPEPSDTGERFSMRAPRAWGAVQNTLFLTLPAFIVSSLLALGLGALAAWRRGRWPDHVVQAAILLTQSTPSFWLALMLLSVFSLRLGMLPSGAAQTPALDADFAHALLDRARHAAMPTVVLLVLWLGPLTRVVRDALSRSLQEAFVWTARAKGVSERDVLMVHALKEASPLIMSALALAAPRLLSGALVVETVFAWPGLGRLLFDAVSNNDSYLAIVIVLATSAWVLLSSWLADGMHALLDPRLQEASPQ